MELTICRFKYSNSECFYAATNQYGNIEYIYPSLAFTYRDEKRIHHYKQWQRCFKTQQFTVDLSFIFITIRLCLSQIDLPTFLTLTDQDLKELGITTFGARRKMLLAIAGELLRRGIVRCARLVSYGVWFSAMYRFAPGLKLKQVPTSRGK